MKVRWGNAQKSVEIWSSHDIGKCSWIVSAGTLRLDSCFRGTVLPAEYFGVEVLEAGNPRSSLGRGLLDEKHW